LWGGKGGTRPTPHVIWGNRLILKRRSSVRGKKKKCGDPPQRYREKTRDSKTRMEKTPNLPQKEGERTWAYQP